jgi:hypothetical protein
MMAATLAPFMHEGMKLPVIGETEAGMTAKLSIVKPPDFSALGSPVKTGAKLQSCCG